jgi:medium-chain acyl-[acyl-carrier-protein] hydrolase
MSISGSWIVRPFPRVNASFRMFCFPYAGSGPLAYRGWAENLPENVDVCYIHPPGREARLRERSYTDFPQLIEQLQSVVGVLLDRPYVFYGHSLGAVVAYEVARALRRSGKPEPQHLFVSASRAPHLRYEHQPARHLSDVDFLREMDRRYGAIPRQLMEDPDLRDLLVPPLRADITLLETYQHVSEEPLGCQITCFGGNGDTMVSSNALQSWRDHTQKTMRLHMLQGEHLFLQTARTELLGFIKETLTETEACQQVTSAEAQCTQNV